MIEVALQREDLNESLLCNLEELIESVRNQNSVDRSNLNKNKKSLQHQAEEIFYNFHLKKCCFGRNFMAWVEHYKKKNTSR